MGCVSVCKGSTTAPLFLVEAEFELHRNNGTPVPGINLCLMLRTHPVAGYYE